MILYYSDVLCAIHIGKVWNFINVNFRNAGTRLVKSDMAIGYKRKR
jgi:hypothetical protein